MIVVQQANPEVIYVPTYNPTVVYGAPVYAYPPIAYPPPGYYAAGLAIGFGVRVARAAVWGGGWGCGWGGNNDITINNNNNFVNNSNRRNVSGGNRANAGRGGGSGNWRHNPQHRGPAPYGDKGTANKFGGTARGDSRQGGGQNQARQQGGGGSRGASSGPGASNRQSGPSTGAGNSSNRGGGNQGGGRQVSNSPSSANRSTFGGASAGMTGSQARRQQFSRLLEHGRFPWRRRRPLRRWRRPAEVGMETMMSEETMKSKLSSITFCVLALAAVVCVASITVLVQSQAATPNTAKGPKAFDTPQQASEAFIKAASVFDVPEMLAILGPDGEDLVASADPVQDKNHAMAFAKEAQAKHSVQVDPANGNRATIIVGEEQWPMPTPLVKRNGKWYFDAKAGRQEILFRRIGANELDAIEVCHIYVEAQEEYASEIRAIGPIRTRLYGPAKDVPHAMARAAGLQGAPPTSIVWMWLELGYCRMH